ncbi:hypothetical protein BDY21DRAFT_352121 [Lineolata rhizophorae]|uniref:CorA-like transporter domain-containing protein n=1 Tax=Lineolata rhizophorae TaxID=578093 RepID=A0A6A6NT07_9PEZI|nr:hypothetical protein BDY21DRAFT_352121 [Lineolata rhizophorae]
MALSDLETLALSRFRVKQKSIFLPEGSADKRFGIDVHVSNLPSQLQNLSEIHFDLVSDLGNVHTAHIREPDEIGHLVNCAHLAFRLSPSHKLFESLLNHFSITSRFKEFAMSFGFKQREDDFAPPACKFRLLHSGSTIGGYECCYGFRYVAENATGDQKKEKWSVRQTAVYQKYEKTLERCIWVVIGASADAEARIDRFLHSAINTCATDPFALHLTLLENSLAEWRWYLADLSERVQAQADRITLADVGKEKLAGLINFNINFGDRQKLKMLEDMILNLQVMLGSATNTIRSLIDHLADVEETSLNQYDECIKNRFSEILEEANLHYSKARALYDRVQGSSSLLSDLLEYENASSLRAIAEEARRDNVAMRVLTEKATKDSGAIKIITIITVFFLPANLVAAFFSTGFVLVDQGHTSVLKESWLFFACTIPLTAITILIWFFGTRIHRRRWNQKQAGEPSDEVERSLDFSLDEISEMHMQHQVRGNSAMADSAHSTRPRTWCKCWC